MNRASRAFALVLILSGLALLAWAGLSLTYQNRLLPNSQVAGVSTGGLDGEKTKAKISSALKEYQRKEIWFRYREKTFRYPLEFGQIEFDIEEAIDRAIKEQTLSKIISGQKITLPVKIKDPLKGNLLDFLAQSVEQEKKEESIYFDYNQLFYQQAQPSISLDREKTLEEIARGLGEMREIIPLVCNEKTPEKRYLNLLPAYYQLSKLINDTPIDLVAGGEIVDQINQKELAEWIDIDDSPLVSCKIKEGCLLISEIKRQAGQITLSQAALNNYASRLISHLSRPAINAKLAFSGGRVIIVSPSQSGFSLDRADLIEQITKTIEKPSSTIKVKAKRQLPQIHEGNIKKLGIKTLIGAGKTTFYGSSDKRVHNIKIGAQAINGALIAPGETFSTAASLGRVNRATGYLPELVIKGDKTVPEYGGGLCQIATTMFRAALESGMEIVERHNHAYRVGYYEPPVGMDATIYIPSPDMKWQNNTDKWILIQYAMSGYHLAFNFYGTDDGRKISISNPRVYNIKSPPKPEYIKDPSLKPGQKIKEEGAHPGADASFRYRVTRDSETLINTMIFSHYQPWGAKYRVGPEKIEKKKKD